MIAALRNTLFGIPVIYPFSKWLYFQAVQAPAPLKWRRLQKAERILLDLGSGTKRGTNGWTTVDLFGSDLNWDLRKGIPLRDGTVDGLYTSHMLEHIPFKQLVPFLRECRRVLKPGGFLSVCVPNAGYFIRAYAAGRHHRAPDQLHQPGRTETGSLLDQVNYIAYMGGSHVYLFDEENLVNMLRLGGFADVRLREFDPALDMAGRDWESVYAIAVKSPE